MDEVAVSLSAEEWRLVHDALWRSLSPDENDVTGHLLLTCEGASRTWVATDGRQLMVCRTEGSPPVGVEDADDRLEVKINPRLFRWRSPQDGVLRVVPDGEGRMLRLVAGDVVAELPEHPGEAPDWHQALDNLEGSAVRADTGQLRDAVVAATAPPFGNDAGDEVWAHIWLEESALRFRTPWPDLPASVIKVPVTGGTDSDPVLFDVQRLATLLTAVDLPVVELVMPVEGQGPLGVRADGYEALLLPEDPLAGSRARLEALLCELLGVDEVVTDDDGDYPVVIDNDVRLYVRLMRAGRVAVQVFSVIASGVEPDVDVYRELNAINAGEPYVKLLHASGAVMAETDLVAEALDAAELENALDSVRKVTLQYREVLSMYFGGPGDEAEPEERTS